MYISPGAVYISNRPGQPIPSIRVQTTVSVPDGGSVSLGGYSAISDGRRESGAPGLSGVPYLNRGFRNVGTGREVISGRVVGSVRIINLRDEEYRQTGYRSP